MGIPLDISMSASNNHHNQLSEPEYIEETLDHRGLLTSSSREDPRVTPLVRILGKALSWMA